MYNLVEYSDSYSDTSGSLYRFKSAESPIHNSGNPINFAFDNSSSFIISSILGKLLLMVTIDHSKMQK